MSYIKRARKWTGEKLKGHLADSTAILTESNPFFTAVEVGLAGMSDAMSMNARFLATGLVYGGMGSVFAKGRDLWRKKFNINDETAEKIQHAHDIAYTTALNLVVTPPMYAVSQMLAGEDLDPSKIAIGALTATGLGAANGSIMGYAVDVFRDLTGLRECNRKSYPNIIKRQSSKVKKGIAAGLIAASIGTMAGIYGLTSDDNSNSGYDSQQTILEEQVSTADAGNLEKNLVQLN